MSKELEGRPKDDLISIIEFQQERILYLEEKSEQIYRDEYNKFRQMTAALEAQNRALMDKIITIANFIPKPFGPLSPEKAAEFWKIMNNKS
jgi:hypothetical protein